MATLLRSEYPELLSGRWVRLGAALGEACHNPWVLLGPISGWKPERAPRFGRAWFATLGSRPFFEKSSGGDGHGGLAARLVAGGLLHAQQDGDGAECVHADGQCAASPSCARPRRFVPGPLGMRFACCRGMWQSGAQMCSAHLG